MQGRDESKQRHMAEVEGKQRTEARHVCWPAESRSGARGEMEEDFRMSIEHNISDVIKAVKETAKQVRFAEAQALNDCALAVQKETVETLLPKNFTLRAKGAPWQRPGTKLGFNIRPFAKRDNLEARVGTQADWTKLQEEGGIKDPANHRIALPTPFWKKREEIMRREKKPSALLRFADQQQKKREALLTKLNEEQRTGIRAERGRNGKILRSTTRSRAAIRVSANRARKNAQLIGSLNNRPFKARMPNGKEGIFVRVSKERTPIRALFVFKETAKIKPRMGFIPNGRAVVNRVYQAAFDRRIAVALATAK